MYGILFMTNALHGKFYSLLGVTRNSFIYFPKLLLMYFSLFELMFTLIYLLSLPVFWEFDISVNIGNSNNEEPFYCLWWLWWDFEFFNNWMPMNLNQKKGKKKWRLKMVLFLLFYFLAFMVAVYDFFCDLQSNMQGLSFIRTIPYLKLG